MNIWDAAATYDISRDIMVRRGQRAKTRQW